MDLPVRRLGDGARTGHAVHLHALPPDDAGLRSGSPLAAEAVDACVARIDFDTDAVFAAHDERLAPVRVAHVGVVDDTAEPGVSVLPGALGHARKRGLRRLWMHCLAGNASMMRIARRAGIAVVVDAGETDASLARPPRDPASVASELAAGQVARFDHALEAQVASIAGMVDAARRGTPSRGDRRR